MTNKKDKNNIVFPLIVGLVSVANIVMNIPDLLVLSNLVSALGIVATTLFFLGNPIYDKLFYVWIIAQAVIIDRQTATELAEGMRLLVDDPILDLSQIFGIKFGFRFETSTSKYGINLNAMVFAYFALQKVLSKPNVVGEKIVFSKFREDNRLGDIFPVDGNVVEKLTMAGEKDWLLVELSSGFRFEEKDYFHVLVKDKDEEGLRFNSENVLVFFRLVENVDDIRSHKHDLSHFVFVDWALAKIV